MLPLLLALAPAPAQIDSAPTEALLLDVTDTVLGTATWAPYVEYQGLVPGHTLRFDLLGPSGQAVFLFGSLDAGVSLPLGAGQLELDPGSAFLLGGATLDAAGTWALDLAVPAGLPLDVGLATQAFRIDPTTLAVEPSNGLQHATVDLDGQVLEAGDTSGHPLTQTGGMIKIQSPLVWDAFWALHEPGIPPQPAPPVDFSRQIVIATFYGLVGMTGYSLEVDQVVVSPGLLAVEQTLHTPGPGCGGGFAMRQPYVLLLVDRVAGAASVVAFTQVSPGAPCP